MVTSTLAAAVIVKNSAGTLERCLGSVADWVDEIVILDSGSEDETESIARRFTQKFYTQMEWPGFGKQRQLAQSYVESDFILWLDADEWVTAELKKSIQRAIVMDQGKQIYRVNRLTTAFGKKIYHSGWSPDWIIRLYRTQDTHYNNALVHEDVILPTGFELVSLKGRLEHHTLESITQYTRKAHAYIKSWADQREGKKSSSLSKAILHGFFRFLKMYIIKGGFLDGRHGLLLAILSANTTFTRYADLWIRKEIKHRNINK